jgi:hypothetical protein
MSDTPKDVVSQVLTNTRWTEHPFPAEYVPALAGDILWALQQAGFSVAKLQPEWGVYRARPGGSQCVPRESRKWCRERAAFLNDRYGDDEATVVTRGVSPWLADADSTEGES